MLRHAHTNRRHPSVQGEGAGSHLQQVATAAAPPLRTVILEHLQPPADKQFRAILP